MDGSVAPEVDPAELVELFGLDTFAPLADPVYVHWVAGQPSANAYRVAGLLEADPPTGDFDAVLSQLQGLEALQARIDARMTRLLAGAELDPPPRPTRAEARTRKWARLEVGAALRWGSGTATARMRDAAALAVRLPETVSQLEDGAFSLRHAQALLDGVRDWPDPVRVREAEKQLLPYAARQTLTEFRDTVRRVCLRLDPRGPAQRHDDEAKRRYVSITPDEDGMAHLYAYLPCPDAETIKTAVQAVALASRAQRTATDQRNMDERRADALAAICAAALAGDLVDQLGALPAQQGRRPAVQVTVALSTLLGLDDQPGELAGLGPIPAALARELAFDPTGTWRRLVTDHRGRLLDCGRTVYRPPAALRDFVLDRDRQCTFPGCRRRARTCEIDHLTAWAAAGTTDPDHLHPACPRHHHARHDAGWHPDRLSDGTIRWTSPSDRAYDTPPAEYPLDTTTAPQSRRHCPNGPDGPDAPECPASTGTVEATSTATFDPWAPAPDAIWPPPGYDPDDPEDDPDWQPPGPVQHDPPDQPATDPPTDSPNEPLDGPDDPPF